MSDYDSYEVIIGANYDGIAKILNITDGRYIGGFNFTDVISKCIGFMLVTQKSAPQTRCIYDTI